MKPNWIVIVYSIVIVAAAFGVALLSGAHGAQRDAVIADQARIADAR